MSQSLVLVRESIIHGLRSIIYRFAALLSKHPKLVLYGGLSLTILAACLVILIYPGTSVNASPDHINHKYFTTVQLESGDTLWDISKDYISSEYASMNDYIKEVETINHISRDEITAGCYLVIPYYSEVPLTE